MTEVEIQRYVSDFFDHLDGEYRSNTARNYKYPVLKLVQYFQETGETLEITEEKVYECSDKIRRFYRESGLHEKSKSTQNVKTNAVRRFLEFTGREEFPEDSEKQSILEDVSGMVKQSRVFTGSPQSGLSKEDVEEMLLEQEEIDAAVEEANLFELLAINVLLDTGCRASEIAATTRQDYNFNPAQEDVEAVLQVTKTYIQGGEIQDIPKSAEGRRAVELKEDTKQLLQDYIELNEIEEDELIFGSYQSVYDAVNQVFKKADVRTYTDDGELKTKVSPHWFRHNKATRLVKKGDLSDRDITTYMGWSDTSMMKVYTHFDEYDVVGVHT